MWKNRSVRLESWLLPAGALTGQGWVWAEDSVCIELNRTLPLRWAAVGATCTLPTA